MTYKISLIDDIKILDLVYKLEFNAEYEEEILEAASDDKIDEVYKKFHKLVNMSVSELKKWAENPCSKQASLSRAPINRVIKLLETPKEKWGSSQVKQANRVISFISRMSGVEGGKEIKLKDGTTCPSKKVISLRNWGKK